MGTNKWVASDEKYPDHSKYLWHLTKGTPPVSQKVSGNYGFDDPFDNPNRRSCNLGSGRDRLLSILKQSPNPTIWCSQLHYMMPSFHPTLNLRVKAACFTECIPHSLPIHAKRFQRFGFLFTKETAYKKGARPVWYLDKGLMNRFAKADRKSDRGNKDWLPFPENLLHLLMPFVPKYGDEKIGGKYLDFMVEREWRTGTDFNFSISEIAAIIVPKEEDIAPLVEDVPQIKDCKFVPVSSIDSDKLEHRDFDYYFITPELL